mmetsp:Transcript_13369/g.24595  ORF Transcript_13369/g.24595 Transcript_13369/m.24595 type:complete len:128 (+) Transcript_13369:69-452(+)
MGGSYSCSTQCAPTCISRGHPPGFDEMDPVGNPKRKGYPVADPLDARLSWQAVAVRHAWRKASASDLQGDENPRIRPAMEVHASSSPFPSGRLPFQEHPTTGKVGGPRNTPLTKNNEGDELVEYVDI